MILGTHNTMTYLTPKEWYLRPLRFLSQCQAVDYKTQHEKYGVNAYDVRLFFDNNMNIEFRHGIISYKADCFIDFLDYCNENKLIVRLLFEERNYPWLKKRSEELNLKDEFIRVCKMIEEAYPNITLYGGRDSDKGEKLYDFENTVKEVGFYSSVTSLFNSNNSFLKIIDDWCPFIYAFLMNKKNKKKVNEQYNDTDTIVHFDFVNVG